MKVSSQGVEFLIEREGMRKHMYRDAVGLPTIGVGHLLTRAELASGMIIIDGDQVNWKQGLTDDQVRKLLVSDLAWVEKAIIGSVIVELLQHQFDALVSFVFNIGEPAFKKSTLLKKLNAGEYQAVTVEMCRWNKAGGRVLEGLNNRREFECKLWNGKVVGQVNSDGEDDYDVPSMLTPVNTQPAGQVGAAKGQVVNLLGQALRSKINWVALSALGLINVTVFKGNLTPEQINTLLPYLTDGVLLLIMLLRSFFPSSIGVSDVK